MTSLLWTYEQSDLYSCDTRTLHLVVMPAAVVGAFRFIVFKQMPAPASYTPVASGHRNSSEEAMEAAETEAERLKTTH
jgi:hypothetical protein